MAVAAPEQLCRLRQLAIDRQARDLEQLPALGYRFDEAEADRVVEFFEQYLRHHKGEWAGQPFHLEPWQADEILRPIFGWFRPDGTRRFREAYNEIGRKNGKTEMAAGVGLYLTGPDGEPGAEAYSAATKRDQARIVHDAARAMVRASPELSAVFGVLRNNIHCETLGSKFEPLGADSSTLDGLNPHGVIADEMHAHKDRHVLEVLRTGTGARRQPLTFMITTAGVYDPESIGWEKHDYAVKVLEGAVEDESFFAYICAADDEDDWRDPETWAKANPNLGVSVKLSYLEDEARKAAQSPAYLNTFLRYHLNRWTNQITRWIATEAWNACDGEPLRLDTFAGRAAFLGLDLSTKLDVSALAVLLPATTAGEAWPALWRFYVPEELVRERSQQSKTPDYAAWVRDGWLTATPGNVIDYEFIRRDVAAIAKVVKVIEIGFDPWNATHLATKLGEDGYMMVEMRQGPRTLSEPSKEFAAMVAARRWRHGGNPVMRWMVSNVTVRRDANDNIAPDKGTAAGKIDGVVATIMGLGRALVQPAAPPMRWRPL